MNKVNSVFDPLTLKDQGGKMLDLVARLYGSMPSTHVSPNITPGFLRKKLPERLPREGESLESIMEFTEKEIFPGLLNWQHPSFFGYFPSTASHAALIGDMFASAFHSPSFTYFSCPSSSELEYIVCDWAVKMLGIPEAFLLRNEGGGTISNSTTESLFLSVNMAKLKKIKELNMGPEDVRKFKLVAYYPEVAAGWANKACFIKEINHKRVLPMKYSETSRNYEFDIEAFEKVLEEDIANGLIPFWFGSTLGGTPTGSFDDLTRIGPICKKHGIFLNVDAAYSGSFWVFPEVKQMIKGLDYADTICVNFAKMMMVGNSGSLLFVRDKKLIAESTGNLSYDILKNELSEQVIDYKDWTVGFGRRFNAMKVFFMMKSNGEEGIERYLKSAIELADHFENFVKTDDRFQLKCRRFGLVTFVYSKGVEASKISEANENFYKLFKSSHPDEFFTPSKLGGDYFLRASFGNPTTSTEHVDKFFAKLQSTADAFSKTL